jgi:hypothetical protein
MLYFRKRKAVFLTPECYESSLRRQKDLKPKVGFSIQKGLEFSTFPNWLKAGGFRSDIFAFPGLGGDQFSTDFSPSIFRQIKGDHRPFPRLAFHPDFPRVLFHHSPGKG